MWILVAVHRLAFSWFREPTSLRWRPRRRISPVHISGPGSIYCNISASLSVACLGSFLLRKHCGIRPRVDHTRPRSLWLARRLKKWIGVSAWRPSGDNFRPVWTGLISGQSGLCVTWENVHALCARPLWLARVKLLLYRLPVQRGANRRRHSQRRGSLNNRPVQELCSHVCFWRNEAALVFFLYWENGMRARPLQRRHFTSAAHCRPMRAHPENSPLVSMNNSLSNDHILHKHIRIKHIPLLLHSSDNNPSITALWKLEQQGAPRTDLKTLWNLSATVVWCSF